MNLTPGLMRLAAAQDGIVTRRQALDSGLTVAALRHILRDGGRWQRIVKGVYAMFTGPVQERHLIRAALLYAGPDAMVTGTTACRAYGLRYVPANARAEILVPETTQRAEVRIARTRRTRNLPIPRQVRSFPYAPPERAAVEACGDQLALRPVRALLREVVQRGLATPDQLVAIVDSGQSAGSALPRRALADVAVGCRSAPECELRDLISSSHVLPEALWNRPLPDTRGAALVPDARIDEARLVIEVDSVEWHRFGETPETTERRRARLAALGWVVLPVSPRRIREEPMAVLGEIEAAYLAGIAR
ncbi:MAG TPA: type IV toxin-antitoxin system AbiEi family antitoxin domain-containing protein [Jiangellaceae bacterium]|nr:type IV toxin-antitoxin system AbiEi family antitoxin domain-containing protein [Jiangellaceae bacterium]